MAEAAGIPDISFRRLGLEDYDAVMRLWTEAGLPFKPLGRDDPKKVAVELERGTGFFLGAVTDEGRLVGVVLGTHDGRKGWINRLAVAPSYRSRGIARLLVRDAEAGLRERGIEVFAALIESDNQASLTFFRAIGYSHATDIEYVSKRCLAET
jgi:ribosomal protein S18 acetylase RimI-like enzyme